MNEIIKQLQEGSTVIHITANEATQYNEAVISIMKDKEGAAYKTWAGNNIQFKVKKNDSKRIPKTGRQDANR